MARTLFDVLLACEARQVTIAPPQLHGALHNMLSELMSQKLTVGLVPSQRPDVARTGGKVRQVVQANPEWYRRFVAQYTARRTVPRAKLAHDTLVKRQDVIAILRGLLGSGSSSAYAPAIIAAAQEYQKRLDAEDEYWREKSTTTEPVVRQASADDIDGIDPF